MSSQLLSASDHRYLEEFISSGTRSTREQKRAYILLGIHSGMKQQDICNSYHVGRTTVWRIKNNYLNGGINKALKEDARTGAPKKYTPTHEAEIIALACSESPKGRARWTVRLLTEKAKQIKGLENISRESVRLILKKPI